MSLLVDTERLVVGKFAPDDVPEVDRAFADPEVIWWHPGLERAAWGSGYATEAARGVLTHAAGLGLRHECALIAPENVRSRRVATRLGMETDRLVVWGGLPHDLWVLDLPADGLDGADGAL